MKTMAGLAALEPMEGGAAIAIGTFDGVHVGHRALIARAVAAGVERGHTSVVVTWDRHPAATLRPDAVPPLLTSHPRKLELIADMGVDALAVLAFDDDLSRWPPERFAKEVLAAGLDARAVFVGDDWRFGHRAAGDVSLLRRLGDDLGFETHAIGLVEVAGGPASSTRARAAVETGDMARARALLGRPFELAGEVVRGDRRGTELGYPTANFPVEPGLARPPRGVYACRAVVGAERYLAAVNVGVNPTFGGDPESSPLVVEAYLLDFAGDLYGTTLRVEFERRLRDEIRYERVADLLAQMAKDVDDTRRALSPGGDAPG